MSVKVIASHELEPVSGTREYRPVALLALTAAAFAIRTGTGAAFEEAEEAGLGPVFYQYFRIHENGPSFIAAYHPQAPQPGTEISCIFDQADEATGATHWDEIFQALEIPAELVIWHLSAEERQAIFAAVQKEETGAPSGAPLPPQPL